MFSMDHYLFAHTLSSYSLSLLFIALIVITILQQFKRYKKILVRKLVYVVTCLRIKEVSVLVSLSMGPWRWSPINVVKYQPERLCFYFRNIRSAILGHSKGSSSPRSCLLQWPVPELRGQCTEQPILRRSILTFPSWLLAVRDLGSPPARGCIPNHLG